jgi:hypothetical protein
VAAAHPVRWGVEVAWERSIDLSKNSMNQVKNLKNLETLAQLKTIVQELTGNGDVVVSTTVRQTQQCEVPLHDY